MTSRDQRIYRVEGMSCDHCRQSVSDEVSKVAGVESVDVDLASGRVTVRGNLMNDLAVRAAIGAAGYDVAPDQASGSASAAGASAT